MICVFDVIDHFLVILAWKQKIQVCDYPYFPFAPLDSLKLRDTPDGPYAAVKVDCIAFLVFQLPIMGKGRGVPVCQYDKIGLTASVVFKEERLSAYDSIFLIDSFNEACARAEIVKPEVGDLRETGPCPGQKDRQQRQGRSKREDN